VEDRPQLRDAGRSQSKFFNDCVYCSAVAGHGFLDNAVEAERPGQFDYFVSSGEYNDALRHMGFGDRIQNVSEHGPRQPSTSWRIKRRDQPLLGVLEIFNWEQNCFHCWSLSAGDDDIRSRGPIVLLIPRFPDPQRTAPAVWRLHHWTFEYR
jgi:hypothetical protein